MRFITISIKRLVDINTNNMNESELQNEAQNIESKGLLLANEGDLEGALNHYNRALELYYNLDDKPRMVKLLSLIGWINRAMGELDQALEIFHRQLELSRELNDNNISLALFNISYTHFYKGDLLIAEEYAKKSFEFCEKNNLKAHILSTYTLFGSISRGMGKYERALDYYNKALSVYEEQVRIKKRVSHSYCYAYRCMGQIFYLQNKIEKSIQCFKKAIEAHKTVCVYKNTIFDYDYLVYHLLLITSCIEINDRDQIESSLEELSIYAKKWPWTEFFWKMGKATVFATRERAKYKIQAQELLNEVLEKTFDYEVDLIVKVGLCHLLLDELKYSGTEDILLEIRSLLNGISKVANKQRSIYTVVVLYSLQARLALFESNVEYANELLIKGLTIASDKGLELYVKRLKLQQNMLFSQLEEWKMLLNRNLKLQESIELLDLKNDLTEAITDVLEKKFKTTLDPLKLEDEEPTLLLIITQGGVIIFSYPFSDELRVEDDLFGSFLDAFNTFSGEVFSEGLDRVKFGDHVVLMEPISSFSVCYLFKGQIYVAKQKLKKFIEGLQSNVSIMQTLDKFYNTSQVVNMSDSPPLKSLIEGIFIHH